MIERRQFLRCLTGLIAAPAIVKISSLMPVKSIGQEWLGMDFGYDDATVIFEQLSIYDPVYPIHITMLEWRNANYGIRFIPLDEFYNDQANQ